MDLLTKTKIQMQEKSSLRDITITNYIRWLKRINDIFYPGKTVPSFYYLKNYHKVIYFLKYNNDISLENKKNFYCAIHCVLKINEVRQEILDEYSKAIVDINKQITDKRHEVVKKEYIPYETLQNIYCNSIYPELKKVLFDDKLDKTIKFRFLQPLFLIAFFMEIPCRRICDFQKLKIAFELDDITDGKFNYLVFNYDNHSDIKFIFNYYKTSNKYGQYIIQDFDDEFKEIILFYLLLMMEVADSNEDIFFFTAKNKPFFTPISETYFQSCFSKTWKRFLPDDLLEMYGNVNIRSLRHSYITYKMKHLPSNEELDEMGKQSGTSCNMMFNVYRG